LTHLLYVQETAPKQRVVGRPFKKGKSGNPSGRPKKTPELIEVETLCKQHSVEAVEKLAHWMRHGDGPVSLKAAEGIISRAFGKPTETKTVTVEDRRMVEAPQPAESTAAWASKYQPVH